jgi:hypothetical protein
MLDSARVGASFACRVYCNVLGTDQVFGAMGSSEDIILSTGYLSRGEIREPSVSYKFHTAHADKNI